MKINKQILLSALSLLLISTSSHSATTGNATPTEYLVTVSNVQFHKVGTPANSYITYASGTASFNIAGASPGGAVGTLQKTADLTAGTYDRMRFTVSKTMKIKGQSNGVLAGNGRPCRTVTNPTLVNNPFGDGSVDEAYLGATDSGTPQAGNTLVPTGTSVVVPTGYTDTGSSYVGDTTVNFTIPEPPPGILAQQPPQITVKFDVTNAIEFQPINANQCVVFPGPPSITISVA